MTHRFNRWLLTLVLLVAVPLWWLLIENAPGGARPKPVHIAELRRLASALPGPSPSAVKFAMVATRMVSGDLFAAGIGLKRRPLSIIAWFLPVPGRGPIMIDTGTSPANAVARHYRNFDRARQDQLEKAAEGASAILVTHAHLDSIGGLLEAAQRPGGDKALSKAVLNSAQIPADWPSPRAAGQSGALPPPVLSGTAPQAAAPGVVVLPAPSYNPGSQLIFVRLGDGREFLFTGDISALQENWQQLRTRSRLVTDWLVPENRAETYGWLLTIRQLKAEAPKLIVVPGHDYEWVAREQTHGTISEALPSPTLP